MFYVKFVFETCAQNESSLMAIYDEKYVCFNFNENVTIYGQSLRNKCSMFNSMFAYIWPAYNQMFYVRLTVQMFPI